MKFSRIWIALAALASLAACGGGDVRSFYVGTYATSETDTFSGAAGTVTNGPFAGTVDINYDANDRTRITLNDQQCVFTAFVNSSTDFTIDQNTCPPRTVANAASGATCTSVFTGSGSGSRAGNDISYSLSGTADISCTDGSSETQTEDRSISGTLQ